MAGVDLLQCALLYTQTGAVQCSNCRELLPNMPVRQMTCRFQPQAINDSCCLKHLTTFQATGPRSHRHQVELQQPIRVSESIHTNRNVKQSHARCRTGQQAIRGKLHTTQPNAPTPTPLGAHPLPIYTDKMRHAGRPLAAL